MKDNLLYKAPAKAIFLPSPQNEWNDFISSLSRSLWLRLQTLVTSCLHGWDNFPWVVPLSALVSSSVLTLHEGYSPRLLYLWCAFLFWKLPMLPLQTEQNVKLTHVFSLHTWSQYWFFLTVSCHHPSCLATWFSRWANAHLHIEVVVPESCLL